MTSDSFNQLFNEYRQRVVDTNTAAVNATTPGKTPTWLQTLQLHVQEWKQHYGSESEAIQQVKNKHVHKQSNPAERAGALSLEEKELMDVMQSFQARRETIWMRQQQELSRFGMAVD